MELLVDMVSQPSRACAVLCRCAGLPVELRVVNILKGGTRAPEFLQKNPLGKVPCLVEAGRPGGHWSLPESCSILRYLCDRHGLDGWYPQDLERRARVDSALDWHHGTLRAGCAGVVFAHVIAKRRGLTVPPGGAAASEGRMVQALGQLEEFWLSHGEPFVAGPARPTIADLILSCEVQQLQLLDAAQDGTDMEAILRPYPRIRQWLGVIEAALAPHYADIHTILRKSAALRKKAGAASAGKGRL